MRQSRTRLRFLAALTVFLTAGVLGAEEPEVDQKPESDRPPPEEKLAVTEHSVTIDGAELRYSATAGTLLLKDEDGTPKASMFFVAYTLDGVEDLTRRPVTFSFNGGPGSSSVWLHLGALGPRRVLLDPAGGPTPPPYRLTDNQHSLLDVSDLVFVDPVTTGYSRAVAGEDPKQFHGVEEDLRSVGEFIRLLTTRFERWSSPKFLIGESYGSTRASGLAASLQERHGMYLNGLMLISPALNFQTFSFHPGNDLPYLLFLPAYAATAWYHQRLGEDLQRDREATLREVEEFALGDYAAALLQGVELPPNDRKEIAQRVARYTGLSPEYVERSNLRIPNYRYTKEMSRDRGQIVGRFDSRLVGSSTDPAGASSEYDPSYNAVLGPFTGAFNHYVRTVLEFESELPYEVLAPHRVQPWDYGKYQNRYLNVAETLRKAMAERPFLKVFVASGYYDLATPYFAAKYTVDHLGIDPAVRGRVSLGFYEAGHMMYTDESSLAKLKADLAGFIRSSLPE